MINEIKSINEMNIRGINPYEYDTTFFIVMYHIKNYIIIYLHIKLCNNKYCEKYENVKKLSGEHDVHFSIY